MIIKSKRVYIAGDFLPAKIEIQEGKIERILPYDETEADIDYGDRRIVPGFIDIHTHGAYGFNTNSADPEGLKTWMGKLPEEGVTSFLPTTVTAGKDVTLKAIENVVKVKKEQPRGADIIGIHLEGPFIDAKYHGAQPVSAIGKPSVEEMKEYEERGEGLVKLMTLAIEHDEGYALTRYCHQKGIVISMGHSSSAMEQAVLAIANGAESVTHTFNGMSPFTHREIGLAGTAMRFDDLYAEMICDGNHVTPEAINIFFRAKGKEKGIMISDSIMAKGYPAGTRMSFDGLDIEIYPDGSAHLVKEGNFAGSTLRLNEGLKILTEKALVPFDTALNACTINPARLLRMDDHIGRICAGYDADIVVLNDDCTVEETYCKGIRQLR